MFADRQRRTDGFNRGPFEKRIDQRTSIDRGVGTMHQLGGRSHQRFRDRGHTFGCIYDAQT